MIHRLTNLRSHARRQTLHKYSLGSVITPVSALAATEPLTFTELKAITETTDGNLSVHTRKLEDAGYITCTKGFQGRVPRTEFGLTAAGRRALQKYLDHMEAIIRHARQKTR